MTTESDERGSRFDELAGPVLASGRVVEGTMMGHRCLRSAATQGFVATVTRGSCNAVVKLPAERVAELIAAGDGLSFAPAGKVFREWVELPAVDDDTWDALLDEAIRFVDGAD